MTIQIGSRVMFNGRGPGTVQGIDKETGFATVLFDSGQGGKALIQRLSEIEAAPAPEPMAQGNGHAPTARCKWCWEEVPMPTTTDRSLLGRTMALHRRHCPAAPPINFKPRPVPTMAERVASQVQTEVQAYQAALMAYVADTQRSKAEIEAWSAGWRAGQGGGVG